MNILDYERRIAELEQKLEDADRFGMQNRQLVSENLALKAERDRLRDTLQTIAAECEIEFQYAADVANTALEE